MQIPSSAIKEVYEGSFMSKQKNFKYSLILACTCWNSFEKVSKLVLRESAGLERLTQDY